MSVRKRDAEEISRQNFRMVNSLVQVRPQVPLASTLDKWSARQDQYREKITRVRYGTPKPLQGLSIRMSINDMKMRREHLSQHSQMSGRSSASKRVPPGHVGAPGLMGSSKKNARRSADPKQLAFKHLKTRGFVNLVPRGSQQNSRPASKRLRPATSATQFNS